MSNVQDVKEAEEDDAVRSSHTAPPMAVAEQASKVNEERVSALPAATVAQMAPPAGEAQRVKARPERETDEDGEVS